MHPASSRLPFPIPRPAAVDRAREDGHRADFRLRPLSWPAGEPPRLLLVVDTEEGFDWNAPLRRDGHDVAAVGELPRLHELALAHDLLPSYVVTWPVLADDRAARVLEDLTAAGGAAGLHLHVWTTPPFVAPELEARGFQGALPAELEEAKLGELAALFRERFGRPPHLHKAGRYGLGPWTPRALRRLAVPLDLSPSPGSDPPSSTNTVVVSWRGPWPRRDGWCGACACRRRDTGRRR